MHVGAAVGGVKIADHQWTSRPAGCGCEFDEIVCSSVRGFIQSGFLMRTRSRLLVESITVGRSIWYERERRTHFKPCILSC